jgi:hypothetical protein
MKILFALLSLLLLLAPHSSYAITNLDQNSLYNDSIYYLENEDAIPDCPAGGGGSALTGSDHVSAVFNFLTGKGLTSQQAAGAAGNMILESVGIEPQRLQGHLTELIPADQVISMYAGQDVSQVGWGIVQFTPFTKITDAAKKAGQDPNKMSVQLDFLWNQLTTDPIEMIALNQLKATSTPDDAAVAWGQYYERPLDLGATIVQRKVYAIAIYEYMVNKTPLPPDIASLISTSPIDGSATSSAGVSGCPGTGSTGFGGYKNPFRDWPGLIPYRIDNGVDYDGQPGPIYAVGNAKIIAINTSSDPALNYLIYQLTDGPAAGLYINLSENCTYPVKVGDTVTADTVICNFHPNSVLVGVEMLWSGGSGSKWLVPWSTGAPFQGHVTNSGLDMNRFLMKLGVPSGINHHDWNEGPPPPADWPVW